MINPLKVITRIKLGDVRSSCCNGAGLESDSPEPVSEEEVKPKASSPKNKKKDTKKDGKK